jgi:predicted alpha/beta hydrolase family esterase
MAAYSRKCVLCVNAINSCRMPIAVIFRVAPRHVQEESVFNMREYVKSRCSYGGESMKHTLAVASSANDVALDTLAPLA